MTTAIVRMGLQAFEDEIIPLHPNAPTHEDYYIHKERNSQLCLELLKCVKWVVIPYVKTNRSPTGLSKRAMDKEMHHTFLYPMSPTHTRICREGHVSPSQQFLFTKPVTVSYVNRTVTYTHLLRAQRRACLII